MKMHDVNRVVVRSDDVRAILADPSRAQLVAQPIVDLRRAQVVGYETLARFTLERPTSPDRVFAAARTIGLGAELEALVVGKALGLAREKPEGCFVTINIEPNQLLSPLVLDVLATQRDLTGVIIELTEHSSIEDLKQLRRALDSLRSRGAMIAIDDAGAGYSGLKQILELAPQFLKVDRDLVTDVHENEAKRALIQMLGELAGRLDAWLLAEGVETEAEMNALVQLGVPLGQGYFLGRPAAPWVSVEPHARAFLAQARSWRHEARQSLRVDGLVERCAVVAQFAPWNEATRIAVRVDRSDCPTMLRVRTHEGADVRSSHDLLRVSRDATIREVALRAATRPEQLRWDPIVCVDERGRFEGVIPLERVVCALAMASDEPPPDSSVMPVPHVAPRGPVSA